MCVTSDRLYTAEQVRRLDAVAIEQRGIPGYTLMNRAGVAVFEAARSRFTSARRWLVLCGAGNNAGDGYVIARLAHEAGLAVTVCALKDPGELGGDAAHAAKDWLDAGGGMRSWPPRGRLRADLVVDALLGTGLDRDLAGAYRKAVDYANGLDCPVVAVDIPTGLHADSGRVMGAAVKARMTVSFIGQKRGLFTAEGPDHCGELVYDDLGTPPDIHDAVPLCGTRIRETILPSLLPQRRRNSHKGNYGHVLVVGGAAGMSGAVRMAGEAALRAGAGLVTVATDPAHAGVLNLARPELMVEPVAGAEDLAGPLGRAGVLAAGPGLGQIDWSRELLGAVLDTDLPMILDADGLNLLSYHPVQRGNWVLTPHPAEAARLLGCSTAEVQADRVERALELARRYQAVVVLKGCGTVVGDSDGRYAICPLGNPGMATAGSGDVLSGIIAGLLAQGLDCSGAARAGVVAHAAAADRVAAERGQRGLLAMDISDTLPRVLNPGR